ncbi:MAG: alpha/beta hydrolase [Candidatus Thorarchaeota archaeon]|nr:MAG: alpha/beta hydrolase [Candidatus Thorarchaeota archaeon]
MNPKRILRFLFLVLCYAILGTFTALAVLYLFFDSTTLGWLIAIVYPSIAPALSVIYIIIGITIIRFSFMNKHKAMVVVSVFCIFMFTSAIVPYTAVPGGISDAENQMNEIYGAGYTNLDTSVMRPVPYSVYDNIYGVPIDESKFSVQENIEYLDNGVDRFFFDFYRPSGDGPFPVIIALHGGAWVIGDKGRMNVILFNRYFASQGYAVFDLNYGLFDVSTLSGDAAATFGTFSALGGLNPNYNGSYTLQQQIENIGEFTKMLELNDTKYSADLSNVFVVGRSAGAHMASLVTLGYQNPLFAGNFSTNMTVKGGIWIYPPTNFSRSESSFFDPMMEGNLPIEEQYKKLSAAFLITNSTVTPPIIIVHGSKDGLADYTTQGLAFYRYATGLGKKCIMITIPWAGHAFDFIFQSYGGQISTYYIERFVALELGGA